MHESHRMGLLRFDTDWPIRLPRSRPESFGSSEKLIFKMFATFKAIALWCDTEYLASIHPIGVFIDLINHCTAPMWTLNNKTLQVIGNQKRLDIFYLYHKNNNNSDNKKKCEKNGYEMDTWPTYPSYWLPFHYFNLSSWSKSNRIMPCAIYYSFSSVYF